MCYGRNNAREAVREVMKSIRGTKPGSTPNPRVEMDLDSSESLNCPCMCRHSARTQLPGRSPVDALAPPLVRPNGESLPVNMPTSWAQYPKKRGKARPMRDLPNNVKRFQARRRMSAERVPYTRGMELHRISNGPEHARFRLSWAGTCPPLG